MINKICDLFRIPRRFHYFVKYKAKKVAGGELIEGGILFSYDGTKIQHGDNFEDMIRTMKKQLGFVELAVLNIKELV